MISKKNENNQVRFLDHFTYPGSLGIEGISPFVTQRGGNEGTGTIANENLVIHVRSSMECEYSLFVDGKSVYDDDLVGHLRAPGYTENHTDIFDSPYDSTRKFIIPKGTTVTVKVTFWEKDNFRGTGILERGIKKGDPGSADPSSKPIWIEERSDFVRNGVSHSITVHVEHR